MLSQLLAIQRPSRFGIPSDDPSELIPLELDKDGDVILIVGKEVGLYRRFLVDSDALARASCVFKAMLFGPFLEGKDQNKADSWSVELPVDDPYAFEIILRIVHAKFNHNIFSYTGQRPDLSLASHICTQTEKYMMKDLLLPFARKWFAYPKQLSCERNQRMKGQFDADEHLHRLSVSVTVGDSAMFWKCLGIYAMSTACRDGELVFMGARPTPRKTFEPSNPVEPSLSRDPPHSGELLFEKLRLVPMHVTGIIRQMRLVLIEMVLEWLRDAMAALEGDYTAISRCHCPANHSASMGYNQMEHNEELLYIMQDALMWRELWPIPNKEDWEHSFWLLAETVESTLWRYPLTGRKPVGKDTCRLLFHFRPMPSGNWQHWDFAQAKRYLCEDYQEHDGQLSQHAKLLGTLPSSTEAEPAVGPYHLPSAYKLPRPDWYLATTR